MDSWRFLDTGRRKAYENIALDHALLRARDSNGTPNTLRLHQYYPSSLVGYHQDVEQEVRVEYCSDRGIEVNRRVTGGGAIYFDESQVGWEIVASRGLEALPKRVDRLYEKVSRVGIEALRTLGVEAEFRPKNDIEVGGRKISGTGGTMEGGAFLFQGTLLVDFDVNTMLRALKIPTEKLKHKEVESVKERVTCLKWELGYTPSYREIKGAFARGLKEAFHYPLEEGELTSPEKKLYQDNLQYFSSPRWVQGSRKAPEKRSTIYSAKKTEGGLIRLNLVADLKAGKIHYTLITGDFFAFPKRTILDLEARFKDHAMKMEEIEGTIRRFFAERQPQMPGVEARDFVDVFSKALEKVSLLSRGYSLEEVNSIFTVAGRYEGVEHGSFLLLPYCAKARGCSLRYQNSCEKCGKCNVGEAYEMAEKLGLKPVTIVNYEHLEETLQELKRRGHKAFYGSCCESFYVKHQRDFERIGLKGILVDIDNTTCYDLGKEEEAYRGNFREQTSLNLELLEKVLRGH